VTGRPYAISETVIDILQAFLPIWMHLITLVPAMCLGIVGGVFGSIFNHLATFFIKQRKKLLAKIPYLMVQRIVRILEVMLTIVSLQSKYMQKALTECRRALTSNFS